MSKVSNVDIYIAKQNIIKGKIHLNILNDLKSYVSQGLVNESDVINSININYRRARIHLATAKLYLQC